MKKEKLKMMNREIGSEYYEIYNSKSYYEYLNEINLNKYFIRSGRDAIRLIAKNIERKKIVLPSYCCDSMISPFQDLDYEIKYYKVNEKFEIDFEDFFEKMDDSSTCLLMNYFGFNDVKAYAEKIKSKYPNCNIILDFTHVIFDIKNLVDKSIDYYVCSMRKCMPILESGLVLSNRKLKGLEKYINNDFSLNRKKAFELKQNYIINPFNENIKKDYRDLFYKADSSLDNDKRIIQASKETIDFLKRFNYKYAVLKRKTNYEFLYNLLNKKFNLIGISKYTPFMLPIFVQNRDQLQLKLAKRGIYTQVIWPINIEQTNCSNDSKKIADTILCIPIDQRYDLFDMNRIYNELIEE